MTKGKRDVVLLTGATGYIGGRLLDALKGRGEHVRCLARRASAVETSVGVEVVEGDVLDRESLDRPMQGVRVAYYLVHSMTPGGEYEQRDRAAAYNFGVAARAAGVERIVYLGGLGSGSELSRHLASRQEVGRILRESGVAAIEFRASIIIGSGSLSFEMVRTLVDRLPAMTAPRWAKTPAQPIAVEDVIAYLVAALDLPMADKSRVYEIGGSGRVSYVDVMREYARQRGLHRLFIPVPVLSPGLSSLWLGLVTPLYARVGRELIEGVRNPTVVEDDAALREFAIAPRGIEEAIARALVFEDREYAQTRWSDALSANENEGYGGTKYGRRMIDSRSLRVACEPAAAFEPIARIGGQTGWYAFNWAWRLRGFLDLLAGGVGVRRGRRDPKGLRVGDALDFWRVEAVEPGRLLRLSAEMKVPGRAWLQFEVDSEDGGSRITQTAIFDPAGVVGQAYWYGLWPLHQLVFRRMLRGVADAAVAR